jgi:hypothetical protein
MRLRDGPEVLAPGGGARDKTIRVVLARMVIPGYDLDDLDENLRERIDQKKLDDVLTDEDRARLEAGESLLDVLDDDDIDRVTA